jgi:AcrR family transcriptional regulator
VARWEPGAPERLQGAALELFTRQGFEQTTTTEIAQAVGLTERTFFRHFSDKREVLFYGQDAFVQAFLSGAAVAPPDAGPMTVIAAAVRAGASLFPDERRSHSRLRQTVIDANPPLQERERHKLAALAVRVADALRARGIDDPAAMLAAESGSTVFAIAFAQWIRETETRSLPEIAADVLNKFLALARPDAGVTTPGGSRPRSGRSAAR